jgi:hypothetical protein
MMNLINFNSNWNKTEAERVGKELDCIRSLDHPMIGVTLDIIKDSNDRHFFIMELYKKSLN